MLRFLLKIWPALLPIVIYVLWVLVIKKLIIKTLLKKNNTIDGEYKIIGKKSSQKLTESDKQKFENEKIIGDFSLRNQKFVAILYLSLIIAIISLISLAFNK